MQTINLGRGHDVLLSSKKHSFSFLPKLQEKQRVRWAQLNFVKIGRPLEEICGAVKSGSLAIDSTDRDGQKRAIESMYWSGSSNRMNQFFKHRDCENRSTLDSATASKARASQERPARRVIPHFLRRHAKRRFVVTRKAKYMLAIQRLQSRLRGWLVRRTYRPLILSRVEGQSDTGRSGKHQFAVLQSQTSMCLRGLCCAVLEKTEAPR